MAKRRSRLGTVVFIGMVDVMVGFIAILFMTMNQGKAQVQAQTYKLQQGIHALEVEKAKIEADIKAIDAVKVTKAAEAKTAAEAEVKAAADKAQAEAEAQTKAEAQQKEWDAQAKQTLAEWDAKKATYQAKWSSAGSAGRDQWVTAEDKDRNYEAVLFVEASGVYTTLERLDTPMKDEKRVQEWVQSLLDSYDSRYDPDHTLSIAIWVERGGNDKQFMAVDAVKAVDKRRQIGLFVTPADSKSQLRITGDSK